MARLSHEALMEELTKMGVEFDPAAPYAELEKLRREASAADESEGEQEEPEAPKAPKNSHKGASKVVDRNVKHNGQFFAAGTIVTEKDDNFDGLEAAGFLK